MADWIEEMVAKINAKINPNNKEILKEFAQKNKINLYQAKFCNDKFKIEFEKIYKFE